MWSGQGWFNSMVVRWSEHILFHITEKPQTGFSHNAPHHSMQLLVNQKQAPEVSLQSRSLDQPTAPEQDAYLRGISDVS